MTVVLYILSWKVFDFRVNWRAFRDLEAGNIRRSEYDAFDDFDARISEES